MMLLETVPTLAIVWYMLIVVLWLGFFFLEGFDFGVGMLLPILGGNNDKKRRVLINTIGPVWDGNEVWLLTAGGAMFAAFPGWYASLFSALYLPLLLMLVGLILRGVAFEYRAKRPEAKWRAMMDWFIIIGSFLPTLVLGVGFANFVIGLPNDGLLFNGTFFGLFGPFALLGGVMLLALFLTHGATFITLKTHGLIHDNARKLVRTFGWVSVALVTGFVVLQNIFWPATSNFGDFTIAAWVAGILAIVALAASVTMTGRDREGWGFILGGVAILALFSGIFLRMYGNLGFAQDAGVAVTEHLNIITAASSPTTLTIMTWAAIIFVPIVIAYQSWSYWVFRRRIGTKNIPDDVEAVA
ncbi:MAG: cytochrome d ubiquinol oxidase subunit II [Propionibacteriaceae bacterium]|nr:cytochrome d ubiquinol oxidase subunit II [Propionibacteriaceae bacterium]